MPPKRKPRPKAKKAVIYTLHGCPYCTEVKKLLRKKGFTVKEHKIKRGDDIIALPDGRKKYTYPQVFFFIGGFNDTSKYLS